MQAIRNADLNIFSQPALIDESLHILVTRHAGVCMYLLASYVWTLQAVWDLNRVGRANMNLFSASLWILLALNMEEHARQLSPMPARPGSRKRVAPVFSVLTLCLFVNLSMSLYQLPSNRLIERRLCVDYYRQNDPSQIQPDGSVDEKLCKIREIEKDLGRIQGAMETLWVAGGKSPKYSIVRYLLTR
ncbi:hypothetical protein LB503_010131 [Fusarium chuoi]|nr:hypothetical protein LB503_010131 [Fusarium chuoi]